MGEFENYSVEGRRSPAAERPQLVFRGFFSTFDAFPSVVERAQEWASKEGVTITGMEFKPSGEGRVIALLVTAERRFDR